MSGSNGSVTVLVADDEEDLAALYATWLEPEYDVRTATGGQEALEKADDSIDVVLLDRRMPDTTGDEVLDELRTQELHVQVAMLTAVEPEVDIAQMPFDDYVTKPVSREEVHATVDVLLERLQYDRKSREFFSLASKKATLESANAHDSDEYQEITDRMDDLRGDIDETLDAMTAKEAFAQIGE